MPYPQTDVTLTESGVHVSQIMDSLLQTFVLTHWEREKQALTVEQAVRMVTSVPARRWGLTDRGLLRPGHAADVTVFDPATIAPRMPEVVHDLPGGGRRFKQVADGIKATVVNGEVLLRDNVHTGAASGQLLREPLAAA